MPSAIKVDPDQTANGAVCRVYTVLHAANIFHYSPTEQ